MPCVYVDHAKYKTLFHSIFLFLVNVRHANQHLRERLALDIRPTSTILLKFKYHAEFKK